MLNHSKISAASATMHQLLGKNLADKGRAKSVVRDLLSADSPECRVLELAIDAGVLEILDRYNQQGGDIESYAYAAEDTLTTRVFVQEEVAEQVVATLCAVICGVQPKKKELCEKNVNTPEQTAVSSPVAAKVAGVKNLAGKKPPLKWVLAALAVLLVVIGVVAYQVNKPLSNGMTKDEGNAVLEAGATYYNTENYEEAVNCLLQLPTDSRQYKKAQELLRASEAAYCQGIAKKAQEYADRCEYEVALALISNARTLLPESTVLKTTYETTRTAHKNWVVSNAIKDADACAANGDYPSAIDAIDVAVSTVGQDAELSAKRTVYEDAYVAETIAAVKAQYVKYDYNSLIAAENILEAALKILPDDKELRIELESYRGQTPAKLLDLEQSSMLAYNVSTYPFEYKGRISDIGGVSHNNAIAPSDWFENSHPYGWSRTYSYAHYSWELDYQYERITGVLFFDEKYKDAPITVVLTITTSSGATQSFYVSNTSQTQVFSVDLKGERDFEIGIEQSDINGTYAYLADVYIWK